MTRPPRLARLLLRSFVPADLRDAIDGDLEESYGQQIASHGRASATAWYWRETLSFATRFVVDRVRRLPASLASSMRSAFSSVDVRLSARLLTKHPGLTITAGFGIAAAIGITAGFFAFLTAQLDPKMPFENGDRFVALENQNTVINQPDRRSARDFVTWREEMASVADVSAFRNIIASLETGPAAAEDITIAGMTASGFRLAGVPALFGRYLAPEDERTGAPPVLVIGYDVWRGRFSSDPAMIGRPLRINDVQFTVIGVMPPRFSFPRNHQYWTTLLIDPVTVERGAGPQLFVFGRLAPGATMQSASTELASIGQRTATLFPRTNARLRPHVLPYVFPFLGLQDASKGADLWTFQFTMTIIVLVVALNVAILVYARTAVRRTEIAVRTALGATRRRIVGQLFVEALALSLPPALCGLALAQYGVQLGSRLLLQHSSVQGDPPPFWMDAAVRPQTAAYVLGLGVLVATIVGVLPALQAAGRHLESDLRELGVSKGMRLGRMWTTLVVAQVAFAVAILPPALENALGAARDAFTRPSYAADAFATGWLSVKRTSVAAGERTPSFGTRLGDLVRTLRANPMVAGVAFESGAPTGTQWSGRIEIEEWPLSKDLQRTPRTQAVDTGFLDMYGARLLTGRQFGLSDVSESARVVIVNRSFVRRLLGDRPALGRRLRYVPIDGADETLPAAWFEIVGVVDDLRHNAVDADIVAPEIYHPLDPAQLSGVSMIVRTRDDVPSTFGAAVHEAVAAASPDLRLGTMQAGAASDPTSTLVMQIVGTMLLLIVVTGLLLSAAGVYALMSFTVAQRRREIGIRRALGASPRQVLVKAFSRATWQIVGGVFVGMAGAALLIRTTTPDAMIRSTILVPAVALVMVAICLGATLVPTRRGLAIEAVETLRSE